MKKTFKTMLAGLLVVPALALGVSALGPVVSPVSAFEGTLSDGAQAAKGEEQTVCLFSGTDCAGEGIFTTITNVLLFLIGAIAVIMLIFGGFRYVVSGGDQAAVTSAKNTIMYAVIGIVVAILAYAVINFVITGLVE